MSCAPYVAHDTLSLGPEEVFTGFYWGKMREIDVLEEAGVEGRIVVFKERNWMAWNGLIWLKIGS